MRECIEILNMMAAGEAGKYTGEVFPVAWLDTRWVTQPPPMIYAGANGPKMLKAAAEYTPGIMASVFTAVFVSRTIYMLVLQGKERVQTLSV